MLLEGNFCYKRSPSSGSKLYGLIDSQNSGTPSLAYSPTFMDKSPTVEHRKPLIT